MVDEVEDFHGVYLLYCLNKRFKGRTYIGYTVDPNRRIKQHNAGKQFGGANRTSNKGPWEMILTIHGFPTEISALQFEWAWQNPHKSRRLKEVKQKTTKENAFQYRWRVVCSMLRTAPWKCHSLTIRWLNQTYSQDFPSGLMAPPHMPVKYGPLVSKKVNVNKRRQKAKKSKPEEENELSTNVSVLLQQTGKDCCICDSTVQRSDKCVSCLNPHCSMLAHLICLADHMTQADPGRLMPVQGPCPVCTLDLLWGELIRHMRGCHKHLADSSCSAGNADQINKEPVRPESHHGEERSSSSSDQPNSQDDSWEAIDLT